MPSFIQERIWVEQLENASQAIKCMRKGNFSQAVNKLSISLRLIPNFADAYFLYSICLFEQGNEKQSKLFEQHAYSINPLCQIYQMPDKKAVQKLESIIHSSLQFEHKISKNIKNLTIDCWYKYTVMLHQQTNYQRAEQVYRRLFKLFPEVMSKKSHAFLGNYANILYDMGKYQEAVDMYEIEIKNDPNQMRFFSNCSMLYTILGNYEKAQFYIKKALREQPNRTSFIFNIGNVFAKKKMFPQSIQKIKQCIGIEGKDPIFKVKLAIILILSDCNNVNVNLAQTNLKKSISCFNQAIKSNEIELVNCGKRILSSKNIQCIHLFSSLFLDLLQEGVEKWRYFIQFLQTFSDYLLVGQATKIQYNRRILAFLQDSIGFPERQAEQGEKIENYQCKQQKKLQKILKVKYFELAKMSKRAEIQRLSQWPQERGKFQEVD